MRHAGTFSNRQTGWLGVELDSTDNGIMSYDHPGQVQVISDMLLLSRTRALLNARNRFNLLSDRSVRFYTFLGAISKS